MSESGDPTFDQLRIFLTVVETGSFAAAGRRLNRATSVISYGVANLEAQLGLLLFDRQGTRRPQLTRAGRAVLAEARSIGQAMDGLRAKVRGMQAGLESSVDLVVDVMLPSTWLAETLSAFYVEFPSVKLSLHVETLGAVAALVLDRSAVLGIGGPLATHLPGIENILVGDVPLVPVAAPSHPLANSGRLRPGAGRDHVQLVLTDRSPLTQGRDFGVVSPRTWRVADLGAKLALLREGIGWGRMPRPIIDRDLASGSLVRLMMPDETVVSYALSAIYRSDAPPGPAASWLLQRFVAVGQERQVELTGGFAVSDPA